MTKVETIIVGGGPAGASAASRLAAAGREVLLLERSTGPHHKVCGEFLSIETQSILRDLAVDVMQHGAVPIDHVALHVGRRRVVTPLPFQALSLSRYRLDQALLQRAAANGACVKRGSAVQGVAHENGIWTVRCDDGLTLFSPHLVMATGKQGLRGVGDNRNHSLVGLKMHLRLPPTARDVLAQRVELFMLDRCYVGLEMIEDDIANLCLVMARDLAAQIGPGWRALRIHLMAKLPRLATHLEPAEALFEKPLAVVCPAGGYFTREISPAAYRVGDRLAHIPPFTGDGLAIAVASGILAAENILREGGSSEYARRARALVGRPIRFASAISRLAANRAGRAAIINAATLVPALVRGVVRHTRLPAAALPIHGQNVSYAPIRA